MSFRGLLERAAGQHQPAEKGSKGDSSEPTKYEQKVNVPARDSAHLASRKQKKERPPPKAAPPANRAKGKMSFKDLMKKADGVDRTKLEMNVKTTEKKRMDASQQRTKPPLSRKSTEKTKQLQPAAQVSSRQSGPEKTKPSRNQPATGPTPQIRNNKRSAPAPTAKPSAELAERIQRRRQKLSQLHRDEDSELSDFVVDDTDENNSGDWKGRTLSDEIWGIFNTAPKRADYGNDSDDDMVATGTDILEEERRSASQARREDALEERRLQELNLKKRRKLSKT